MMKTTSRHLLDILAEVPDFRNNRGKKHPLSAILGLAVIAMMCGCGNIPPVMAALRNTVITLLHISGHTQIEKAQRFFAAHPWHALKILQKTKSDN